MDQSGLTELEKEVLIRSTFRWVVRAGGGGSAKENGESKMDVAMGGDQFLTKSSMNCQHDLCACPAQTRA